MSALKYPRTPHLPGSNATSDDKHVSPAGLALLSSGIELVVTEKMDGGNYTLTREKSYARSLDGTSHLWDNPAKAVWAAVAPNIPEGWRISGESMYARRSVAYDGLPGWFMVFGVWDETDTLLSWDETIVWADLLDLPVVPTLYRGTDFAAATSAWGRLRDDDVSEGFVLRDAGSFPQADFPVHVAKWVRENHVRTAANWRQRDDFELNTRS